MEEIGLVLLLLLLPLLFLLTARIRAGKGGEIRPLRAIDALPDSVGLSAEAGQPLHVSVGVGGVGTGNTAETWAGLSLLAQIADDAAACDAPLIITVADPTVLPIAQDFLRRAYLRHGNPGGYDPTQVRLIAPTPMAYAAGVAGLLERGQVAGNVMAGTFGDEFLLMGETGAKRGIRQIVGAADPLTLPFVYASADETLIGEEMFGSTAQKTRLPAQIASVVAEDWARWVVIVALPIIAIVKMLF
jgi:hypothetical protein